MPIPFVRDFFVAEALQFIDQQRVAGSELFKLVCNIGPFDSVFASSRQMMVDAEKQDTPVQIINALQTDGAMEHSETSWKATSTVSLSWRS